MLKPTVQTVVSMTTLVLFLAAIGIWIANGGIGRIREATGSHAGGAGAYTETWTANKLWGFNSCSTSSSSVVGFNENNFFVGESPRLTSTKNIINPSSTTSLTSYGQDVGTFSCRVTTAGGTNNVVTEWTVTGHINP